VRKRILVAALVAAVLGAWWLSLRTVRGYTRLDLADGDGWRSLGSFVLRDGEQVALRWRNSLFGLDVTEVFRADGGSLVQTEVTFAHPDGSPPPQVSPRDVDDLYHTGGAFSARGLERPLTRVVYRLGEVGNPRMTVGGRVIALKREVGFGGRVVLSTSRVRALDVVLTSIPSCGAR
jgi:hypothetical protein